MGQIFSLQLFSFIIEPLPITDLEEIPAQGNYLGFKWNHPVNSEYSKFSVIVKSKYGDINMQTASDTYNITLASLQLGTMFNVTVYVLTDYENSTGVQKTFYTSEFYRLFDNHF